MRLSFWPIFTLVILGVLAASAWIVIKSPERLFEVSGEHLGSSLAREHPRGVGGGCSLQEGRDFYWCGVEVEAGEGYGPFYRLGYDDEGCWRARRGEIDVVQRDPRRVRVRIVAKKRQGRLSGCLSLNDFVSPIHPEGGDGTTGQLRLRGSQA